MTQAHRIPGEQRSYIDPDAGTIEAADDSDRRALDVESWSVRPDERDANPAQQGRFGDLKHNLTNAWKVQVR
jgi:hypothetical protein